MSIFSCRTGYFDNRGWLKRSHFSISILQLDNRKFISIFAIRIFDRRRSCRFKKLGGSKIACTLALIYSVSLCSFRSIENEDMRAQIRRVSIRLSAIHYALAFEKKWTVDKPLENWVHCFYPPRIADFLFRALYGYTRNTGANASGTACWRLRA